MVKSKQNPWGKTPRKRDNQFAVKKDALLQSAAALFREKGYEGASLNDLAEILNITKPTIYYYVQSKDQLLLEILISAQDKIITFMHVADEIENCGYNKLRRIMIDYAQIMVSDFGACLSRIWIGSLDSDSQIQVEKRIREADRIIFRVLDEGIADKTISVSDKTVALHALFGSLNWMASWAKPNLRLSPLELAEIHVDILLGGVRGTKLAGSPETT